MNSSTWAGKEYDASEMAWLYNEMPGQWLLLEILEKEKTGRAKRLRLLAHAAQKEDLYDYLLECGDWSWRKKYIFVFSDPEKTCEL